MTNQEAQAAKDAAVRETLDELRTWLINQPNWLRDHEQHVIALNAVLEDTETVGRHRTEWAHTIPLA